MATINKDPVEKLVPCCGTCVYSEVPTDDPDFSLCKLNPISVKTSPDDYCGQGCWVIYDAYYKEAMVCYYHELVTQQAHNQI